MRLSLAGNRQYEIFFPQRSAETAEFTELCSEDELALLICLYKGLSLFFVNTRNIGEFVALPTVKGTNDGPYAAPIVGRQYF